MDNKIIAVDFDGTLCTNKWPEIGEPIPEAINYVKNQKEDGAKLILWTCRVDGKLVDAVNWCKEHGIEFDAINENLPEIVKSFGGDCRKVFANEYIDDRNNHWFIQDDPDSGSMLDWAAKEIELAIKSEKDSSEGTDDWEYGVACYKSALRAYRSLSRDGHSGFSIGVTKSILNRLIDGRTLTPIEDTPDVWNEIQSRSDGVKEYQCSRMSSLFKRVDKDGVITYRDIDRAYGVDIHNPDASFTNGLIRELIDKIDPIKMPYLPRSKRYRVRCEQFLFDPKNGDYDTEAFLDILTPDGKTIELNRYFKEEDGKMVPIEKAEFEERKAKKVEKK